MVHVASTAATLRLFVLGVSQQFSPKDFVFHFIYDSADSDEILGGSRLDFRLKRGGTFFLSWFQNRRGIRVLRDSQPDLVHIHNPAAALAMLPFLSSLRGRNIRLVYTARGGLDEGVSPLIRFLWEFMDPLRWGNWDAVGTVNRSLQLRAMKFHPNRPVVTLSHGGAIPNMSPSRKSTKKACQLPQRQDGDIWLVWCGRFAHDKRPADFPRIVRILRRRYRLKAVGLVVGDSNKTDRLDIRRRSDHIHYLGWRDFPNEIFRDCDLLISTSVREGYGLAILEAGLVGTPTLAYLTNGTSESIADVGGTLVLPKRVKDMAAVIAQWAALSPEVQGTLREAVREKSALTTNLGALYEQTKQLYFEACR